MSPVLVEGMVPGVVTIRSAEPADIPALAEMGQRFLANHPAGAGGDAVAIAVALSVLLTDGFLWIAADVDDRPVGMLAGALRGFWFQSGDARDVLAAELAWWIDPDYRRGLAGVRLLRRFERWAEERGAVGIVLSDIIDADGNSTSGDIVARAGYQLIERAHFRWSHTGGD